MAAGNKKSETLCSLLMASLFALSASFQFNDTDWYFWIPLYVTACIVNLVNGVMKGYDSNSNIKKMTKFTFWFGVCLFVKVVIEDFVHGISGFLSLDMRERVVREKFGSGLVICSMFLHLGNSSNSKSRPAQLTKYGMPILVGTAYGISFIFFVFHQDEMRY
ncbi:hypothetical protein ACJIZ3_014823 [Penstemon smallii]|uniref:Transmembrane protein 220 n=1 Tax=Penstemon smallii TaxID=265156 RepID=A0ABD3RUJ8_9LAMI